MSSTPECNQQAYSRRAANRVMIKASQDEPVAIKDSMATPMLAFGYYGFGVVMVLVGLINLRVSGVASDAANFGPGVFCGGFAQLLTGLYEFKHGNEVGGAIFSCFGVFWLAFAIMKIPGVFNGENTYGDADMYNAFWGLFNAAWIPAAVSWVILNLQSSFAGFILSILALANFVMFTVIAWKLNDTTRIFTGVVNILTGLEAQYVASAILINKYVEGMHLPLGPAVWRPRKHSVTATKQGEDASYKSTEIDV